MEVIYNVKHKFKTKYNIPQDEIKKVFNLKLINVILKLENNKYY